MTPAYLLDTHAAIWLVGGDPRLGKQARATLETETSVAISDITLLEIAMLAKKGVLTLLPEPVAALQRFAEKFTVLPITARIAIDATTLQLPHRDPFDRVIATTAIVHGLVLVTKDQQIVDAHVVKTIW